MRSFFLSTLLALVGLYKLTLQRNSYSIDYCITNKEVVTRKRIYPTLVYHYVSFWVCVFKLNYLSWIEIDMTLDLGHAYVVRVGLF